MFYVVNAHAIGYGDRENVQEFQTVEDARQSFRETVRQRRPYGIAQSFIFRTREEAEAAIIEEDDEFDVREDAALEILDWEHGFGFSFE